MSVPLRFDQLDSVSQKRVRGNLAKMQAANAPDTDIESYLRDVEHLSPVDSGPAPHDIHSEYASGRLGRKLARENQNDAEMADAESQPTYAQKALGGIASLAKDIPGAEAAQAGMRAMLRRQPYREALSDIRSAEDAAPTAVRTFNRIAGAAPAYMLVPGSNMTKGAIIGALQGFTDADPEADRSQETITRGAVGGALGLAGDMAGAGASKIGGMLRNQGAKEVGAARSIVNGVRNVITPKSIAKPQVRLPSASPRVPGLERPIDAVLRATPPVAAQAPTAAPSRSIDDVLEMLVGKMRAEQPNEIGSLYGDAEEAMNPPAPPQLSLEELLRRSIVAKGGTPLPVAHP